ncbi:MAG: DUF2971 domain-containing protein [Proteocatella sp.]
MKNDLGEDIPRILYKYMSWTVDDGIENYSKSLFKNRRVHLQEPKNFNDPFDCKIYFKNCDKERNLLKENYSDDMNLYHRTGVWVTCLTEDPKNILMWSHYADKHQGICLELDMLVDVVKMEYDKNYPVYDMDILDLEYTGKLPYNELIKLWKMFHARKSDLWKYEKEYRFLTSDKSQLIIDGNKYFFPLDEFAIVKSIICGCRMKEETICKIQAFLKEQKINIPIKQTKEKLSEYGLDIESWSEHINE